LFLGEEWSKLFNEGDHLTLIPIFLSAHKDDVVLLVRRKMKKIEHMQANIQRYNGERDTAEVFNLWQATVGREWPLEASRFERIITGYGAQNFIAQEDGQTAGFVATRKDEGSTGYIAVLLVAPEWQRQGIGTALHQAALQYLSGLSVKRVQLGGGSPRFFPGVPDNLPSAVAFFRDQGWEVDHVTYDLVQDLRGYATPPAVWYRLERQRIRFEIATKEHEEELLAFEEREFPQWLGAFQHVAMLGDYSDLLIGRDEAGQIVASLILYTPESHPERSDVIWQVLLGNNTGAIGCVGVAEAQQGRGIGIALVARATELLLERGVDTCYIDWVVLIEFYAKLGYEMWREYHMCWRDI
jgi:beta-N-acetylhexosaminidase